jgi:hypothetical protein
MEGNCNLNMNSVQEKKEEKYNNNDNNGNSIINEVELTKEEQEYGDKALCEILLDDDDEKKDESKSDNFSKSTEFGNSSNKSDIISKSEDDSNKVYGLDDDYKDDQVVFESKEDDCFKDDNYDNYFDPDLSNFDKTQKEYDLLFNNLVESIEKDKEKEINYLNAINDIFPGQKNLPAKDLLLKTLDSIPGGKKEKEDEIIDELKKNYEINDFIDDIGELMEKVKGSFRITDGKKNGDNFSFKYYKSGWKGGSRARIKTYDVEKIGKNLRKLVKPFNKLKLSKYFKVKEIVDAYKEDGNKFGTKTTVCLCKKAVEKTGSFIGTAIGTAILGPIGGFVGSIIGSNIGGLLFEKIGEFFCKKNEETVNK